jgi:hypothetical protein
VASNMDLVLPWNVLVAKSKGNKIQKISINY